MFVSIVAGVVDLDVELELEHDADPMPEFS